MKAPPAPSTSKAASKTADAFGSLVPLLVPALRAQMGDWIYYSAFLKLRDVADRINTAQEVHPSTELNMLLQRALDNKRTEKIATYLVEQRQRFFNTLVVGVYGGDPQFYELKVGDNKLKSVQDIPHDVEGSLGFLELSGKEKLFALDGQHRVVAIRKAVKQDADLGTDEITTIFVGHHETPAGRLRTRRLFSTLNRYAKPVNKKEIIALDEDDIIAILTRRLLNDYALFTSGKVSATGTNSIPKGDNTSFTTIVTIYDCLDSFLSLGNSNWTEFKRFRRSDEEIEAHFDKSVKLWDRLRDAFPEIDEVATSKADKSVPGKHRSATTGGHLLFRPIGLVMTVRAIRFLVDKGATLKQAVDRIAAVPMQLNEPPWDELLWDTENERILYTGENQKVAYRLLIYGAGGQLSQLKKAVTLEQLKEEWAGIVNRDADEMKPKRYV
jgi:DNA sulfur modification protein DndB